MEIKNPPGKTIAIVAYLTFVGTLIAYFMNQEKKFDFGTAHIKNMFGLLLIQFIHLTTYEHINELAGDVLWWTGFSLWLFSLITAIVGLPPSIPVLSKKFQSWFLFLN